MASRAIWLSERRTFERQAAVLDATLRAPFAAVARAEDRDRACRRWRADRGRRRPRRRRQDDDDEGGARSLGSGRLSCRRRRAGRQGGRGLGEGSGHRLAARCRRGSCAGTGPRPARRQDRVRPRRSRHGVVTADGAVRRSGTKAGAKLVLVGDPEQLQPIEAGAAFRAIAERIGYAELETIYRQREQWMRDASLDLARGQCRQSGRCLSRSMARSLARN